MEEVLILAKRPIFFPNPQSSDSHPVIEQLIEFQWYPGFSLAQKQKSIVALHSAILSSTSLICPLEISSKSPSSLGVELSAFNLQLSFRSSCALTASVETVYQGSKTFNGCPRSDGDRFALGPRESRHRARELGDKGRFSGWEIGRYKFPLSSGVDFYNWLYLGALHQSPEVLRKLASYDCFTDIEFNPQKSLACQARSAALAKYHVLNECSLLPYLRKVSSFHDTKANKISGAEVENLGSESDLQLELQF